jgi:hypothetical protein
MSTTLLKKNASKPRPKALVKPRKPKASNKEPGFSTLGSLLPFFGTWVGNDAKEVRRKVRAERLKATF